MSGEENNMQIDGDDDEEKEITSSECSNDINRIKSILKNKKQAQI